MTIPNRTVSIKSVFASTANTTIPTPPATGVSYRNTGTTAAEIGEGWPFKEVVDSAKFNQAMYEYTTICQQLEKYGFLPWSANTDYPAQGCALGSDGNVYQAKQATGPSTTASDPVYDTNHTYWDLFYYSSFTTNRAIVSNASGKLVASSITDTQLSYLSGATSNIQAQINTKATPSDIEDAITGYYPKYNQAVNRSAGTTYTASKNCRVIIAGNIWNSGDNGHMSSAVQIDGVDKFTLYGGYVYGYNADPFFVSFDLRAGQTYGIFQRSGSLAISQYQEIPF